MGQSIKTWIGAAVAVAVLIAIAGWFLVISPTRAATADIHTNIESEASRTVTLTQQLKALSSQFDNLDVTIAKLKGVSVQVPTTADAASFRRVIVDRAATSGVTITILASGAATAVVPPAATSSGTSTSAPATPIPSPSSSSKPAAAPGASAKSATALVTESGQVLVGVPVSVTVLGTYASARAFIASMQGTDGRLFLVYAFNLVTQPDAPKGNGRPATVKGDVELFLQGYLVVLTAGANDATPSGATPSPTSGPKPSPTPLPSTARNPFAPVG